MPGLILFIRFAYSVFMRNATRIETVVIMIILKIIGILDVG